MGGPDVGAGSHGRHVGGHGDDEPGGSGPSPGGADEHGHRRAAVEHLVHDLPHRRVEAARRVQAKDQEGRPRRVGLVDGLHDVGGGDRVDHALELDHGDFGVKRDGDPERNRADRHSQLDRHA